MDAGITGGLRQVQAVRESVTVDAAPASREVTSWKVLWQAGFRFVGEWTHDPNNVIKLDVEAPVEPGVYAFVVDDSIAYVGLTNNGLRTRFEQYRRGYEGQRTNARVNKLIAKTLSDGQRVKVLVATPRPTKWHGLSVNIAAGLEAGLIEMIRPPWNIQGAV